SSRVGARISARGPRSRDSSGSCVNKYWNSAMRWAAVLPVPDCAWPATSRPSSAIGSALLWIGVQYVKPASSMPRCSSGASENSENLSSVKCSAGAEAVLLLDSSACKLTSQGVKIGHQARTLAFPNPLYSREPRDKRPAATLCPSGPGCVTWICLHGPHFGALVRGRARERPTISRGRKDLRRERSDHSYERCYIRTRCTELGSSGAARLLGRVVRSLQDDLADPRRNRRGIQGPAARREAQHRRESTDAAEVQRSRNSNASAVPRRGRRRPAGRGRLQG